MPYAITTYSKNKAEKLGVKILPSTTKGKKIDVFKNGVKIASIGDTMYGDYPTYLKKYGKKHADERRRLYKLRHEADRKIKGSPGYYADQILW